MATRNGQPKKFRIEGTPFLVDQDGLKQIEALKAHYVGKPVADCVTLPTEIRQLYERLREKGHLFTE